MSLPLYQASEAITVAVQSEEFKKQYNEVTSKLGELQGQLAAFNSTQAIVESLGVDYQSSDDFAFIANAETGEEEVFQIHGVLTETRLPPVIKGNRVSMNGLVQTIKLIGTEDDQEFRLAGLAISRMFEFLQQSVGARVQAPYAVQHGIAREFTFVNRLLTPSHSVFPDDIVDLPSSFDPSQSLKDAMNEGKFAFTKDNQVSFSKLSLNEDNQFRCIEHIKPGTFRPGQIVNAGVSFRLLKSKPPTSMRFIAHLDSVSLLSWGARKILDDRRFQKALPKRGLPAKRRAYIQEKTKETDKSTRCMPMVTD